MAGKRGRRRKQDNAVKEEEEELKDDLENGTAEALGHEEPALPEKPATPEAMPEQDAQQEDPEESTAQVSESSGEPVQEQGDGDDTAMPEDDDDDGVTRHYYCEECKPKGHPYYEYVPTVVTRLGMSTLPDSNARLFTGRKASVGPKERKRNTMNSRSADEDLAFLEILKTTGQEAAAAAAAAADPVDVQETAPEPGAVDEPQIESPPPPPVPSLQKESVSVSPRKAESGHISKKRGSVHDLTAGGARKKNTTISALHAMVARQKEKADQRSDNANDDDKPPGPILGFRKKAKKFSDMHKRVQAMLDYLALPNVLGEEQMEQGAALILASAACPVSNTLLDLDGQPEPVSMDEESDVLSTSVEPPVLEWEMKDDSLDGNIDYLSTQLHGALVRFQSRWEAY
ncbi:hypothetical protein HDU91_002867 [Kappamyces sp. JEL0680]|nr:hypothetical protein HDU91_002867 [Kappamyces sp. JEL0680]